MSTYKGDKMSSLESERGDMRANKRRRLPVLAAVAVSFGLIMSACGSSGSTTNSAQAPTGTATDGKPVERKSVHMGMSTVSIAVPGPWVAEVLGYYDQEGIDIKITTSEGSVKTAQQAVTGQYDLVYASSDAMLQAMDTTGTYFYPFFNIFYQDYRDWIVPEGSNIKSVKDLKGTTIGVSDLSGGEMPLVHYLLKREGIDPEKDVKIVAVGAQAAGILQAFEQKRIDSMARTRVVTVALKAQNFAVRSIFPEDILKGAVEGVLASEKFSKDKDLLERFARATAKGFLFCQTNVDACVKVIGKKYPDRVVDAALAKKTITDFLPSITPPQKDGKYFFGPQNADELVKIVDVYSAFGSGFKNATELKKKIPSLVLNDDAFNKKVNTFDYDGVINQAKNYAG
jgi:NitT/TauT family transport system substrate-binding protein